MVLMRRWKTASASALPHSLPVPISMPSLCSAPAIPIGWLRKNRAERGGRRARAASPRTMHFPYLLAAVVFCDGSPSALCT